MIPDIESVVLSCLMKDDHIAHRFVDRVKEDYFTNSWNRYLFRAIQKLFRESRRLSIPLVNSIIQELGFKDPAINIIYELALLEQLGLSTINPEDHVIELKAEYMRRELERLAYKMQKSAKDYTVSVDESITECRARLSELLKELPWDEEVKTQPEVARMAFEERKERLERKKKVGITGIPTGIPQFDEKKGGWQPTELIVIGGQNGHGKTWLLLHHLMAAAKAGFSCLVYSLEMANPSLYARQLMLETQRVNSQNWYNFEFQDDVQETVDEARKELDFLPIYYMDKNNYNIDQLCSLAWEQHELGRCDILFVDYAQIISIANRSHYESRMEVVTQITHKLKALAKELHIPIILLAQLNRQQIKNPDGRPQKSDLRESGSLEQDADRVFLIYRPYLHDVSEYLNKRTREKIPTDNLLVYIVAKDRYYGETEYLMEHSKTFSHFTPL